MSCGVSQCVHRVSPWTPRSPKWCPRYQKWSLNVSKMTVAGIKSDPFQQSTSQPVNQSTSQPVHQSTRQPVACQRGGRRQWAKPLNSPHPRRGSRACANRGSENSADSSDSKARGTYPLPPAPPKSNQIYGVFPSLKTT